MPTVSSGVEIVVYPATLSTPIVKLAGSLSGGLIYCIKVVYLQDFYEHASTIISNAFPRANVALVVHLTYTFQVPTNATS